MKKILTLISLIVIAIVAAGCNNADDQTVKIGVVGENTEIWEFVRDKVKEDDINLEIVSFDDYNQPNIALDEGDIDLNAFQHKLYLENFNDEHGTSIVEIADTIIEPLGIYSNDLKSVDEVKEGDKVSIPNDVTNGGRALLLLQSAGLIKVDEAAGSFPTIDDITENQFNLEIIELDAAQTSRSLNDVAIAIVNADLAVDAGFVPNEDAIFLEPIDDNSAPYVNIIAAKEGDDREIFQKIIDAYQSDDTIEVIDDVSKHTQIPAWK